MSNDLVEIPLCVVSVQSKCLKKALSPPRQPHTIKSSPLMAWSLEAALLPPIKSSLPCHSDYKFVNMVIPCFFCVVHCLFSLSVASCCPAPPAAATGTCRWRVSWPSRAPASFPALLALYLNRQWPHHGIGLYSQDASLSCYAPWHQPLPTRRATSRKREGESFFLGGSHL